MVAVMEASPVEETTTEASTPPATGEQVGTPQEAPPLTGQELLTAIDIHTKAGKRRREVIFACGYGSTSKDGRTYVNTAAFYEALTAAKGIQVGAVGPKNVRTPSYLTKVLPNGSITLNPAYSKRMGIKPGATLSIGLHVESQAITLKLVPPAAEAEALGAAA